MICYIITSIYNALVQMCCGGKDNQLVNHYKELYNKQKKISCVADKLSPCYRCWIWSMMIELMGEFWRWDRFKALV